MGHTARCLNRNGDCLCLDIQRRYHHAEYLRTTTLLAANLAIGAFGCEAFRRGRLYQRGDAEWRPGLELKP